MSHSRQGALLPARATPGPESAPAGLPAGPRLVIPWSELEITRSRSSGPGGQNVNKVETRIDLRWNVAESRALDDRRRQRLLQAFAPRLTREGVLIVRSMAERSQEANRRAALERLSRLVSDALKVRKLRRPTRPTASSRERRLEDKRRRSRAKTERSAGQSDE